METVADRSAVGPTTRSGRQWRALAAEVLLTIFVIAAVERGFRAYVDRSPQLPLPPLLNSSIATAKYLAFRSGTTHGRHSDIILMGLSPMMVMNSGRMSEVLRAHGRAVDVFNYAFPFHSIDFDRILMRDIVLPSQGAPRLLVYGVMPFNILYEHDPERVERETRARPAFQFHEASFLARLRARLLTSFDLLLYREVIRDYLLTDAGKPDPWVERAKQVDEKGDAARLPPRPAPKQLPLWERQVYKPQLVQFQQKLRQGLLSQHIVALAAFCREHGTRLLVVNTAVSPFFPELLVNGRSDYDEFVWRAAAAARAAGAAFLDLSGPDLGAADDFVDTHHLNEAAALIATDRIAAYVLDHGLLDGGA